MDTSTIPGIPYINYTDKESGKKSYVPPSPPWTTWSGYMECPLDSQYGKRLRDKCKGEVYMNEGKQWVKGNWTAPIDWPEMAAGREDPRPFSSKTHSVSDFPFISPNLK